MRGRRDVFRGGVARDTVAQARRETPSGTRWAVCGLRPVPVGSSAGSHGVTRSLCALKAKSNLLLNIPNDAHHTSLFRLRIRDPSGLERSSPESSGVPYIRCGVLCVHAWDPGWGRL
eukprot:scaffold5655_cov66-Phaeocystis_antarctica.AAC.4